MATTHTSAIRSQIADSVVDSIDVGSTDATGDMVFMTSGDAEVATLNMSNPAFGAAAAGVATANSITNDTSAAGGTTALYKCQNRDNTEIFRGSVTATGGGGDIELSSVVIGTGDTVSVTSFTYTAPN